MTRRLIPVGLVAVLLGVFALNAHNSRPSSPVVTISASAATTPHIFRDEIRQEERRAAQEVARQAQAQADAAARALREQQQAQIAARASRNATQPRSHAQAQAPVYYSGDGLPAGLICIRGYESHGNYAAKGAYYGAYQYSISTWANYKGYHTAADAPPAVQDERALSDYNKGPRQIHQNWPNTSLWCGL